VREGADQILGAGLNGFVLVDLTVALGFHEGFVVIPRAEDAKGVLSAVKERIAKVLPEGAMASWLRDRPTIVGILGFAYVPGVVEDGAHPLILRAWVQRPVSSPESRAKRFFLNLPSALHLAGSDSNERMTSEPLG